MYWIEAAVTPYYDSEVVYALLSHQVVELGLKNQAL